MISKDTFDRYVRETLESIPEPLKGAIENVAFLVDHETSPAKSGGMLLGLYQGVALPRRVSGYSGALPDTITVFHQAIERACPSEGEVEEMVRRTVIHELAHYFGFSEREIQRLGY